MEKNRLVWRNIPATGQTTWPSPRDALGHSLRNNLLGLLFALASGGLACEAFAQSPSQITPRSFEPSPPVQGGEIVIPESTGPEAPAGAEQLFVGIAGVKVEGGFPALREQERAVIGEIAGKRVSAADLFVAARKLEQAYIAAGYGLVRVVLPAQRLKDGTTVRLVVIDGIVERIDTSALPDAVRQRVADVLAPLVGRHALTMAEIERALLLAGDTPGTALRSTLKPGSRPGTGVLVIEARFAPGYRLSHHRQHAGQRPGHLHHQPRPRCQFTHRLRRAGLSAGRRMAGGRTRQFFRQRTAQPDAWRRA